MKADLVLDSKAFLGEGPVWDDRKKVLYWVDILNCILYIYSPITRSNSHMKLPYSIGAIALCRSENLILATCKGFYILDLQTGKTEHITDPENDKPHNRFNDGKCDPAGRFYAGTMHKEGKSGLGSLYCMEKDKSVRLVFDGISISNGIAWSHDSKIMYYINTPEKFVRAYEYDLSSGNVKNHEIVIDGSNQPGVFDGMTIDKEGNLWIAHFGGYMISVWDPETGKQLDEIKLPIPNPTSCTFGGTDLTELYITTARLAMSDDMLKKHPLSGGLFVIRTDTKGYAPDRFPL